MSDNGTRVALSLAVLFRRLGAMAFAVIVTVGATDLFIRYADTDGMSLVDDFRCGLIALTTLWLAWGAALSLMGLLYLPEPIRRIATIEPAGDMAVSRLILVDVGIE